MGLLIPVLATFLGLLVGAILMLVTGYNPIDAYSALLEGMFGDSYYIGELIRTMTPSFWQGYLLRLLIALAYLILG